jgi:ADP-ribose pyrophosphatase YjhB (NUDIX family)
VIRVKAMAVIRRGDAILASHGVDPTKGETFHRPLGGGVEFGETGEEALRREFREELAAELDGVRRRDVVENMTSLDRSSPAAILIAAPRTPRRATGHGAKDTSKTVVPIPAASIAAGSARPLLRFPRHLLRHGDVRDQHRHPRAPGLGPDGAGPSSRTSTPVPTESRVAS